MSRRLQPAEPPRRRLFRDRLRTLVQREVSQAAFARRIDVPPAVVSSWLRRGGSLPSFDHLTAMADLCAVSVDWLTGAEDVAGATPEQDLAAALARYVSREVQADVFARYGGARRDVLAADGGALLAECVASARAAFVAAASDWARVYARRAPLLTVTTTLGALGEYLPTLLPAATTHEHAILATQLAADLAAVVDALEGAPFSRPAVWFNSTTDDDSAAAARDHYLADLGAPTPAQAAEDSAAPGVFRSLVRRVEHQAETTSAPRAPSRGKPAAKGGRSRKPA